MLLRAELQAHLVLNKRAYFCADFDLSVPHIHDSDFICSNKDTPNRALDLFSTNTLFWQVTNGVSPPISLVQISMEVLYDLFSISTGAIIMVVVFSG